jgi:hypothetical protein
VVTLGQFIILNHGAPITVTVPEQEENFAGDVVLYPNPAAQSQSIIIRTSLSDEMQISIYDAMGKEVLRKKFSGSAEISSAGFSAGIYSWSVRSDKRMMNGTFVVE